MYIVVYVLHSMRIPPSSPEEWWDRRKPAAASCSFLSPHLPPLGRNIKPFYEDSQKLRSAYHCAHAPTHNPASAHAKCMHIMTLISPKYTMPLKKNEGYFLDKTGRLCPTREGPSENIMIHKKKQRRYNIWHLSVYRGRERASKWGVFWVRDKCSRSQKQQLV